MLQLRAQVESMSDELVEINKQKLAAQNLAVQKQGESTRFAITANNLRHKLAKKEHAWESVQKELKYIVEHLGNGAQASRALLAAGASTSSALSSGVVNIHVDLKNLYTNFFASKSGGGGGSHGLGKPEPEQHADNRSLIEKVENEATRQRNFLEKSLQRLRNANTSLASRTKAEGEKALGRAITSLYEINRLREENQRLFQRCGLFRSMVVQAGLGKKLDLIDSGDEGGALMQIEEEHKEAQRQHFQQQQQQQQQLAAASSSDGSARRRLMASSGSSGRLDDLNEAEEQILEQPRRGSGKTKLAGSASSAILPSVNGGQRVLRDSQSTPALPAYESGSSEYMSGDRPMTSSSSHRSAAGGSRGSNRRPPGSPQRGSTRPLAEQAHLQNRAAELERRLEQVNQHVSLQQVHISALQTAIRSSASASAAAQAASSATAEASAALSSGGDDDEQHNFDLDGSDQEDNNNAASSSSSSHFFPASPVPTSGTKSGGRARSPPGKDRKQQLSGSASRGRLSPLRKGAPGPGAGAQQLASATLRGSNVSSSSTPNKRAPNHSTTATAAADGYGSMQSNIESTLAGREGGDSASPVSSTRSSLAPSSAGQSARASAEEGGAAAETTAASGGGIAAVLNAAKNKKKSAAR
jgi:hypothetical protein